MKVQTDGDADQEPQEPEAMGFVSDLLDDDTIFRRAGLGLGEKASLILQTSLKVVSLSCQKFVTARAAVSVKFWGKIFGLKRDYYIVETDVDPGDQEEIAERHEPKKQPGINKKIYFVTNDRSFS